jgi:hypothetical protein
MVFSLQLLPDGIPTPIMVDYINFLSKSHSTILDSMFVITILKAVVSYYHTVEGRNPAPPWMLETL